MLSRLTKLLIAVATTAALITAPAQAQHVCTGAPGHVQSPVEIDRSQNCGSATPAITISYGFADGTMRFRDKNLNGSVDNHDDVSFVPDQLSDPHIMYGTTKYKLTEVHYHFDAEHKFQGQAQAPAEAHFVHASASGSTVVLGVLIDGVSVPASDAHDHPLAGVPTTLGDSWSIGSVNLAGMLPANKASFRYSGSLTSSPYTPVHWVVLNDHVEATDSTIAQVKAPFGAAGNNRDRQNVAPRIYPGNP
ncbi:carbonic anhydrase family protein [Nonomuraea sp. NPDC050540]|uniref:carbonic anhydrase family protein n=1 Tax=Nonomuraea sp. NPDC050540 TaxID=3364367 RepID=UPI0037888BF7